MSNAIALIHGYGFDQRTWLPLEIVFDRLEALYFSLPGFGADIPNEAYTIASLAKRYWASIDAAKHPTVHLAGHSMGGYVCMEMAAQQPSRVASLALIHSHVFEDTAEKKTQRTATMSDIQTNGKSGLVKKLMPSMFANPDECVDLITALIGRGMQYDDLAWYYGAQAMRDRANHEETLKKLNVPVLMLAGEKDKAVPAEFIFKQAPMAVQNRLHLYPGTGHMGMYENTAQMICDMISFYTSLESGNEAT